MTIHEQTVDERVGRGMTPYPSQYLVLEARHGFSAARYDVAQGERRTIRYGYEDPKAVPKVVREARAGLPIDWGGSVCTSASYAVVFDGLGPVPEHPKSR